MNRVSHRAAPLALAALMSLTPLGAGDAQDRLLAAIQYSVAQPIGQTHDFAPSASFSGLAWEWRSYVRPHTSIGVLTGFNEFQHRNGGTFDFPRGSVTGEHYRHLLVVPITVTGAWYFNSNRDDPRWYIGGGLGPRFIQQLFQLGLAEEQQDGWDFTVVPEAGLAFKMWYGTGGIVSLRYHIPLWSDRFMAGFDRFQFVSLSFGIGLRETDSSW